MTQRRHTFSVVILTFNRNHLLARQLASLGESIAASAEVIVVDNASEIPAQTVTREFPWVKTLRAPRNLGAAGRNLGFEAAANDIVICLDDDISGLSADALDVLDSLFATPSLGAVNFMVLEEGTGRIVNWVHHRDVCRYAGESFETYEITEGAVAFRRSVLSRTGGYPESFFLSHEGPDLAYRMMNLGYSLIYSPAVSVVHSFAPEGRTSWRNYYFDTRNAFWLAARNLPLWYGSWTTVRQIGAMFIYSWRDGYLKWWFKAVWDALKGMPAALGQRRVISGEVMTRVRSMDSHRPTLGYWIRRQVLQRGMRL